MIMKGLVLKSTGSWYKVKILESGTVYNCRIRGKFKLEGSKTTNPVSVGDHVDIKLDSGNETEGIITNIYPRENYIIRKSVKQSSQGHILAANVDQAIVVATVVYPQTSLGFIDRFLVSCESFRIPAFILFNKADILGEDELAYQMEISEVFKSVGYKVLSISALEGKGLSDVKEILIDKVTLVAGHSGVGKSTLLNKLSTDISQKIEGISDFSMKGKHTTTFAEMFELSEDTYIIDTPGIKELGLIDMEPWEISHYFPEMRTFLGECKFNNCLHINEPGCKVLEALVKEEIHINRYESYLSILDNEDNRR
jgi:ribosome biogenesis GTPase